MFVTAFFLFIKFLYGNVFEKTLKSSLIFLFVNPWAS
jgi:hypothetical protein